ncbi:hypothetical protein M427DRAFT_388130 [Gonapodya prolifera JEL478]|uniref:HSP70-domain-containing protein n=1 Tax=Gonapodya prolifera (strain JEL478) TaxID=1344416 RepID=A0A139A840_GONPJ|nr:hypothetical protein M427DRAFT_388130 [Gonapodya prolifera JEL478]|eukprot:KXS12981.1 hypothetical protein M427DRAFT_388130 [Gonapodya prolifera JEL478]
MGALAVDSINVGGGDIVNEVHDLIIAKYVEQKFDITPEVEAKVRRELEKYKIQCSQNYEDGAATDVGISNFPVVHIHSWEFEKVCQKLIEHMERLFADLLFVCNKARTQQHGDIIMSDIKRMVLSEGGSYLPHCRDKLKHMFRRDIVVGTLDPKTVVASGAAFCAHKVMKGQFPFGQITNTVPMPISIVVKNTSNTGYVPWEVVKCGKPIPVEVTCKFVTTIDTQASMELKVLQGMQGNYQRNNLIGSMIVGRLPKRPKGSVTVALKCSVTIGSQLRVEARIAGSDQNAVEQKCIIQSIGRALNENEVELRGSI